MARGKGRTTQDKQVTEKGTTQSNRARRGAEDTTRGNWAANDMSRGGVVNAGD
jgi:hypothetical protein